MEPRLQTWMVRTAPGEFYNIRAGNRKDVFRLVRIIAGTAHNLVLSGGGAKSLAQFGALRAFAEAMFRLIVRPGPVWAYISALYCFGGDLEEVIAHTRKEVMRRRPAHDHTLPIISILSGRKLTAIATSFAGRGVSKTCRYATSACPRI
jgi:NTE family protein